MSSSFKFNVALWDTTFSFPIVVSGADVGRGLDWLLSRAQNLLRLRLRENSLVFDNFIWADGSVLESDKNAVSEFFVGSGKLGFIWDSTLVYVLVMDQSC